MSAIYDLCVAFVGLATALYLYFKFLTLCDDVNEIRKRLEKEKP